LLVALLLAGFSIPWSAQAVVPAPDGGYPNNNTAEGDLALSSLTTGADNTAVGLAALVSNLIDSENTAVGTAALLRNTASQNTAVGSVALFNNTAGTRNTGVGFAALFSNNPFSPGQGNDNTAVGFDALFFNTGGSGNIALGSSALFFTTGSNNIALDFSAGSALTTGNNNIDIGNAGVAAESDTIHIGSTQTKTFIAGINGVNQGSRTAVFINTTTGQLGTTPPSSSRQYKKEIKPMDQVSEAILCFKPVTFHYKSDTKGTPQFGLIAEEVAEVNPDLIVRDDKGEIYSVRYDAVNAMLLNEFLKEHRKVEQLEKQVEALTAGLQKVSAQLELSKSAPQTVANNQ
jgi:Chaperone of endosialidase